MTAPDPHPSPQHRPRRSPAVLPLALGVPGLVLAGVGVWLLVRSTQTSWFGYAPLSDAVYTPLSASPVPGAVCLALGMLAVGVAVGLVLGGRARGSARGSRGES